MTEGYNLLRATDAHWRESNQMKVDNTDLAKHLGACNLGARMWRLRPGQASTKHRHLDQEELYVLLEGRGRIRIGDADSLTIEPLDSILIEPSVVRQIFNDTDEDALWLVVGAPPEAANTLEMTPEQLSRMYPDGPRALPPELGSSEAEAG
jgi:quercetin dioxygenase-like cupin family protein